VTAASAASEEGKVEFVHPMTDSGFGLRLASASASATVLFPRAPISSLGVCVCVRARGGGGGEREREREKEKEREFACVWLCVCVCVRIFLPSTHPQTSHTRLPPHPPNTPRPSPHTGRCQDFQRRRVRLICPSPSSHPRLAAFRKSHDSRA
jgi:hypothetical protein